MIPASRNSSMIFCVSSLWWGLRCGLNAGGEGGMVLKTCVMRIFEMLCLEVSKMVEKRERRDETWVRWTSSSSFSMSLARSDARDLEEDDWGVMSAACRGGENIWFYDESVVEIRWGSCWFLLAFCCLQRSESDRKMTFEVEELVDTRNRNVEEWFE